jgi:multimeric flavodoxin WrbA
VEPLILGIAGSLRNGRWGADSATAVDELKGLETEDELRRYVREQADLRLQDYIEAGRAERLPFDQTYANLRKGTCGRGLSNSEVALAAGMWAALRAGARLDRVSLVDHFPMYGGPRDVDALKERLAAADGILVSMPVYFGDRGSPCQSLIELIRADPELRRTLSNKVYAGMAVGAKRNGGQETALVYQLMDMARLGLLVVGNDSDTTSQYGGTVHAGDVGTAAADEYGLQTAMGTGRRVAHVAAMLADGRTAPHRGRVRVLFWILQDHEDRARRVVDDLVAAQRERVDATILDLTDSEIARCIACDICPTHVGDDLDYRCIIATSRDEMSGLHDQQIDHDAIVPIVYCSDSVAVPSTYQRFIERTRYLRRGDYALGDTLTAPLVLEELGALQNMHMRAMTSLIRHHTVAAQPMVGYVRDGQILDAVTLCAGFASFVDSASVLAGGRLRALASAPALPATKYNPVGYVLSAEKDREDELLRLRKRAVEERRRRRQTLAATRLGDGESR